MKIIQIMLMPESSFSWPGIYALDDTGKIWQSRIENNEPLRWKELNQPDFAAQKDAAVEV